MAEKLPLISIIMPLYNAELWVGGAVASIQAQTVQDWELIVADDGSRDSSLGIVSELATSDGRIKVFSHVTNKGAAAARNTCLSHVRGAFVAYMDADDLWYPEKLERQLAFMKSSSCSMCFTDYETITQDGRHINFVSVPKAIDYNRFLKNTVTCSHTVVFDLSRVEIDWLFCPDFKGEFDIPEDMVVWLQVLKNKGVLAMGLNEVLAKYRKHDSSRSASVLAAVSRTWNAYRRVEGMSFLYSVWCLFWQLKHALAKRVRN